MATEPYSKPVATQTLLAFLMLMSLLGVFPIDVLLPSFPALSRTFAVDTDAISLSVSLFALGVAISQCLIGPLSDRLGRTRLLHVGLIASIAGALGCALSSSYVPFMAFRALQALGWGVSC